MINVAASWLAFLTLVVLAFVGLQVAMVRMFLKSPKDKPMTTKEREDILQGLHSLPFFLAWKPLIKLVAKHTH